MRLMEDHTSPTLVCDRSDTTQLLITRLYELRPTTLYEGLPSRLLTRPTVVIEDQPVCKGLTDSATIAITCSATLLLHGIDCPRSCPPPRRP